MKQWLYRLKLAESFTVSLPVTLAFFANRLADSVEPGNPFPYAGDFASIFDGRIFFGAVSNNGFQLRRKNGWFLPQSNALATGHFFESDGQLTIITEVRCFFSQVILILAFVLLLMMFFVMANLYAVKGITGLPALSVGILLFLIIPYIQTRYAISVLQNSLTEKFSAIAASFKKDTL